MLANKGQSILEYGIIIAVVTAAAFSMQLYFRRGINAAVKVAADQLGRQEEADNYDFKEQNTMSNSWISSSVLFRKNIVTSSGGRRTMTLTSPERTETRGTAIYKNWKLKKY